MIVSRILGIDPGLCNTGWGIVEYDGFQLKYISHGVIESGSLEKIGVRLGRIFEELSNIIKEYFPQEICIEEVFVNNNSVSSLKLGMARGAAICCAGILKFDVSEYGANKIKKTVVGSGHATKEQVSIMVQKLLKCANVKLDAADALAIAICHAHHKTKANYDSAFKRNS